MSKALEALEEIKSNPNAENNPYRFDIIEKELKRLDELDKEILEREQWEMREQFYRDNPIR